ncbi:MAG: hypothetical protein R2856_37600 [Caldilineaceae bacterium]
MVLGEITRNFVAEMEVCGQPTIFHQIRFEQGQRKDDVAAGYRRQFKGGEGVVFIGSAQEKVRFRWGAQGSCESRPL